MGKTRSENRRQPYGQKESSTRKKSKRETKREDWR